MPYQADDVTDVITTTLRDLEKRNWADIVLDLQRHVALPMVMKKHRQEFGSGYGHQFNVRLFSNNAARNVKLNEEDNPTTADLFKTGNVPWRHSETHWAIEDRIVKMNRSPARLVNLLEANRMDAMTDLAELIEQNFWTAPSSSSDTLKPYGVPYWIVKNNTTGFNGGLPTGFTDVGGLSPTTYPRWKNYTAQYTAVTKVDLVRKLRTAMTKTNFRAPVDFPSSTGQKSGGAPSNAEQNKFGLFCGYDDVIQPLEELLEAQNDNLGNDVASRDGKVIIRRLPLQWVPYLDENDTTDPIYGIDWDSFKCCFLSGEYINWGEVMIHPKSHRTKVQYCDSSYNFICKNRRQNFVVAKNTGV